MATAEELKTIVCDKIDEQAEKIIDFAKTVEKHPELGFKETKTAKLTAEFFKDLGLSYREGLALTGVKATLKERCSGPNVAILGELDAVRCPDSPQADPLTGAAHACGHNLQLAAMIGAATGLKLTGAAEQLDGNVTFMAVPAEEYVEIAYRSKLRQENKLHFLGG